MNIVTLSAFYSNWEVFRDCVPQRAQDALTRRKTNYIVTTAAINGDRGYKAISSTSLW